MNNELWLLKSSNYEDISIWDVFERETENVTPKAEDDWNIQRCVPKVA